MKTLPQLRQCLFLSFYNFFISSREIQKLDDPENEKLKAPLYELLTFGAIQLLNLLKANKK
jgi:hypothetical protein